MHELINESVMNTRTREIGTIIAVDDVRIEVDFDDRRAKYPFPQALAGTLMLKNKTLREKYMSAGEDQSFESYKKQYIGAIREEINYIQIHGGKRYRAIDGELIASTYSTYTYLFETDSELHIPDDTQIKLYLSDRIIYATVLSCEEFSILFRTGERITDNLNMIEFSADQWRLLEALIERTSELNPESNHIGYEVACTGRSHIKPIAQVSLGQPKAIEKVKNQPVTFIWGPPGTGKTRTLAMIAMNYMGEGKRVLMLSYSNVSVDGAVLRLVQLSDKSFSEGEIVRYGYPRMQEIMENRALTSYQIVLEKRPDLAAEYESLLSEKKKLKKADPRRLEINKRIAQIRSKLKDEEKELIHQAAFVATTVSKAVVDQAIYGQTFDLVIFDEASMAYVPHVVFAAGLAKERFCCLGDFRQLPAIVQNNVESILVRDIFEYTGIVEAVDREYGHDWLVMLNYQYRMHPYIAEFVSGRMYENLLKSEMNIFAERQKTAELGPLKGEAMGLIDVSGTYSVCVKTMDGSRINLLSALLAVFIAKRYVVDFKDDTASIVLKKRISDRVGIITPYNAQSRLIVAMLRDLQEMDPKYKQITCATVHQFQGSEKNIIIYDAVDCYRMSYPGMLLTSKKNDTANRLFNVALTRTQGKFLMIANRDYLKRKKIAKDLIFTQFIDQMCKDKMALYGNELIQELVETGNDQQMYLGDRDEKKTWDLFLNDIRNAAKEVHIDIPGVLQDNDDKTEFTRLLSSLEENGVKIRIRYDEDSFIPEEWEKFAEERAYIVMPITIVDREIIWYGEPLSAPDFMAEGNILETEYYPCVRFKGTHISRSVKAFLEI